MSTGFLGTVNNRSYGSSGVRKGDKPRALQERTGGDQWPKELNERSSRVPMSNEPRAHFQNVESFVFNIGQYRCAMWVSVRTAC
jgi:hypothetical protein